MKEIWINLELYIKSYEFPIFRDFFRIFLINFKILNVKNNLIKAKRGFFRAGPMWMRRGTQGHVAAPREPTQRLRGDVTGARYLYLLLYSL